MAPVLSPWCLAAAALIAATLLELLLRSRQRRRGAAARPRAPRASAAQHTPAAAPSPGRKTSRQPPTPAAAPGRQARAAASPSPLPGAAAAAATAAQAGGGAGAGAASSRPRAAAQDDDEEAVEDYQLPHWLRSGHQAGSEPARQARAQRAEAEALLRMSPPAHLLAEAAVYEGEHGWSLVLSPAPGAAAPRAAQALAACSSSLLLQQQQQQQLACGVSVTVPASQLPPPQQQGPASPGLRSPVAPPHSPPGAAPQQEPPLQLVKQLLALQGLRPQEPSWGQRLLRLLGRRASAAPGTLSAASSSVTLTTEQLCAVLRCAAAEGPGPPGLLLGACAARAVARGPWPARAACKSAGAPVRAAQGRLPFS
jgi:hypothetical protein